jgi:hypothetical protein
MRRRILSQYAATQAKVNLWRNFGKGRPRRDTKLNHSSAGVGFGERRETRTPCWHQSATTLTPSLRPRVSRYSFQTTTVCVRSSSCREFALRESSEPLARQAGEIGHINKMLHFVEREARRGQKPWFLRRPFFAELGVTAD